ncbi:MAG: tRNA (cytidine(34)-2'-O)-methyltransferase [Lachnospiraceae bacterium]|nr:tRNA (cytidine(34)-2'-O)-methyltransferase [Lachnospiraceae bacterium]
MFNIVLYQPEIPANTGNIGRTCVATGSRLHLIGPLGFQITDKQIKRAGLDYWPHLDYIEYDGWKDFQEKNAGVKIYMATTKGPRRYCDVHFEPDSYIMFGRESAGIPEKILYEYRDTAIRIPMNPEIRSLNLGNSVAIVLYEALRQNGFRGMQFAGKMAEEGWIPN